MYLSQSVQTGVTEPQRLGGLKPQKFISHGSGCWQSKTTVPAVLISGETPLPGLQTASFLLWPHMACTERALVLFFFLYGHEACGIRVPPLWPQLTLIISLKDPSPNTVLSGLMASMSFQSITAIITLVRFCWMALSESHAQTSETLLGWRLGALGLRGYEALPAQVGMVDAGFFIRAMGWSFRHPETFTRTFSLRKISPQFSWNEDWIQGPELKTVVTALPSGSQAVWADDEHRIVNREACSVFKEERKLNQMLQHGAKSALSHAILFLQRLSFLSQHVFNIHSVSCYMCSMFQNFIPFYVRITLHCRYTPHLFIHSSVQLFLPFGYCE